MTQVTPTWLGSFFGADLGFLNYEILTIQHIPRKELKEEPALMRTKWFDYRRLHPMQATYYLADCYNRAYGDFMAMCIDRDLKHMRGFKGKDFLNAREKLSFWRLRQLCDRLGIRYDFFMRHAMRWCFKNGWTRAPRPQHITSNEDLITDAMLAWEEECAAALQVARDPWFLVQNYAGHEDQRAHEQFVVAQIKTRRHPQYALNAALYVHDVLRIEEAIREFDLWRIHDAIGQVSA